MEIYSWEREKSDMTYHFSIYIGYYQHRFGNEGVLEPVEFHINNYIMYETTFGREQALKDFGDINREQFEKTLDSGMFPTNGWSDEDINDFRCWIINSLTPKTTQRKEKIDRIQKKLPYAAI